MREFREISALFIAALLFGSIIAANYNLVLVYAQSTGEEGSSTTSSSGDSSSTSDASGNSTSTTANSTSGSSSSDTNSTSSESSASTSNSTDSSTDGVTNSTGSTGAGSDTSSSSSDTNSTSSDSDAANDSNSPVTEQGPPTLTSDKQDYSPGETAFIQGSGLNPETNYDLYVYRGDGWIVKANGEEGSETITTDPSGIFNYPYELPSVNGEWMVLVYDSTDTNLDNQIARLTFEVNAPTLSTDKFDYDPSDTAIVSGKGFSPGMSYDIVIERPDGSIIKGDGTFTDGFDSVIANSQGRFSYSYILNGISGNYMIYAYRSSDTLHDETIARGGFNDANSGPKFPSTATSATWSAPVSNALASDNICTTSSGNNQFIDISNFGFTSSDIPVGAVITGIQVELDAATTGNGNADARLFTSPGTLVGSTQSTLPFAASCGASTFSTVTAPGNATWGRTWSQSEVTSSGFGIEITQKSSSGTRSVDSVRITITFATSISWEKRLDTTAGTLNGPATFEVSPDPSDNVGVLSVVDNGPFDKDSDIGQLTVNTVQLTTFTITETTPTTGTILDDDVTRTITVSTSELNPVVGAQGSDDLGNTEESDFHNRVGTIEWEKRLEYTGALQGGATFSISPDPSDGIGTMTVVDNGANDLDPDAGQLKVDAILTSYVITETIAPAGTAVDDDNTRSIVVSVGDLNAVVGSALGSPPGIDDTGNSDESDFHNRLGSISWEKRLMVTGTPLVGGATFTITPDPTTGSGTMTVADNGPNDSNLADGQFTINNARVGSYTLTETIASPGTALDNDVTRSVSVSASDLNAVIGTTGQDDPGNSDESDFHNRVGSISWEKRDNTNALQGGATFTVTPNPLTGSGILTVSDNTSPDSDSTLGQFVLQDTYLGTYIVTETVAPPGWLIDPASSRTVIVSSSDLNAVIGTQGSDDPGTSDESDFHNVPADAIAPIGTISVSTSMIADATVASPGTFTVTVDYDEAMDTGVDPTIAFSEVVSNTLTLDTAIWTDGDTFVFTYTLTDANEEVPASDITVDDGQDVAGNVQIQSLSLAAFSIDTKNPIVQSAVVSHTLIADADDGETFTVTVTYSEAMDGSSTPTITFSPDVSSTLTLPTGGSWTDTDEYTFSFTIDDAGVEVADVDISDISGATDVAGNSQVAYQALDQFDIDTKNPSVTTLTVTDSMISEADEGDQKFQVIVTYDEPMDTSVAPTIAFENSPLDLSSTLSLDNGAWSNSDMTYTATYDVADANIEGSETDNIDVKATGAQDVVGNTQVIDTTIDLFSIDTKKPVLTLPASFSVWSSGSSMIVTYSASASDLHLAAGQPVCTPPSGSSFPLGTTTVNCTALDTFGNTISGSFTVNVFKLAGFYQPIDMSGVYNKGKAGNTIPFKFNVYGGTGTAEITDISIFNSIKYKQVTCPSGSQITDDIEVYATGGTSIRYDSSAHQFIYNGQTLKADGGKCFTATLYINTPTGPLATITANLQLTKI